MKVYGNAIFKLLYGFQSLEGTAECIRIRGTILGLHEVKQDGSISHFKNWSNLSVHLSSEANGPYKKVSCHPQPPQFYCLGNRNLGFLPVWDRRLNTLSQFQLETWGWAFRSSQCLKEGRAKWKNEVRRLRWEKYWQAARSCVFLKQSPPEGKPVPGRDGMLKVTGKVASFVIILHFFFATRINAEP